VPLHHHHLTAVSIGAGRSCGSLKQPRELRTLWSIRRPAPGSNRYGIEASKNSLIDPHALSSSCVRARSAQNDYLYFFHDQPYFIDGITETNARLGLFSHQGQFVSYLSPSGADVQQVYGFNVATNTLFMSVSVPSTERHIFSTVVNFSGTQSTFTQLTTTGGYYRACTLCCCCCVALGVSRV